MLFIFIWITSAENQGNTGPTRFVFHFNFVSHETEFPFTWSAFGLLWGVSTIWERGREVGNPPPTIPNLPLFQSVSPNCWWSATLSLTLFPCLEATLSEEKRSLQCLPAPVAPVHIELLLKTSWQSCVQCSKLYNHTPMQTLVLMKGVQHKVKKRGWKRVTANDCNVRNDPHQQGQREKREWGREWVV